MLITLNDDVLSLESGKEAYRHLVGLCDYRRLKFHDTEQGNVGLNGDR